MQKPQWTGQMNATREYFDRSTRELAEEDSGFRPAEGCYSVAEQVAHTAQTIDWFLAGAFNDQGYDTDFQAHDARVREVTSLDAARAAFQRAVNEVLAAIESRSEEEWAAPIAGDFFGGQPRSFIFGPIAEHTAHHRGSLAVYTRLLGRVPPMPYMDV